MNMTIQIYDLREHIGADKLYVLTKRAEDANDGKVLLMPTVSGYIKSIKHNRNERKDLVAFKICTRNRI
jgi:hypothetical protein